MQANEWGALIDKLAGKLAVPVAQLWEVLTRQSQIVAVTDAMWAMFQIGVAVTLWSLRERVKQWAVNADDIDVDFALSAYTVVVVAGVGGLFAIFALYNISSAIQYTMNPQYFALKQVLEVLK